MDARGSDDVVGDDPLCQTADDRFGAMATDDSNRIFAENMLSIGAGVPKLPWEEGIFGQIFGSNDPTGLPSLDSSPKPAFPVLLPEDDVLADDSGYVVPAFERGAPMFAKHVKALCKRDCLGEQDLKWTKALASWLTILESCAFAARIGDYVLEKLQAGDREGALVYIRDSCSVRSPSAVLKRAKDLQMFIAWCQKTKRVWWPLDERILLAYLGECELEGRSKFIGKNLVHALKFFRYLMGAKFDVEQVVGPLLHGRVSRVLSTRDPTHQARPLTVKEVAKLERLARNALNIYDRYFAGCMLFVLYSRARWSDLSSLQSFFYDVVETNTGPFGFVGGRTRVHKTSNSVEKKAMYLPFVAPIQGITERHWGLDRKEVLEEFKILVTKEPFGAVCRAPKSDGTFTKRPLSTSEASDMLNDLLEMGTDDETTSRSLKSMTLVWCARYGLGDERCLGTTRSKRIRWPATPEIFWQDL